ncbi:MAG TPA: MerR family transcriptional regulator [Acidimicrobiales bacterium]|nr:MerR family transcriptional regulator [Acidimicrobiales bacterium]
MISIGDFARMGRVSVRMLRHYDAIGLLQPERVDPHNGYRFYTAEQLRRLNRIVALKDLGLRLEQVRAIVDEQLSAGELRAMLRLRQAELTSQIADSEHRLARVQARLRLIDTEDTMTTQEVTTKTVPAMTTVGLTGIAASATQEQIGPLITGLYPPLLEALGKAGVCPIGPSVAYYSPAPEESQDAIRVQPTFPVGVEAVDGLDTVRMPAAEVASLIHHGTMDGIDATYQALYTWAGEHGCRPTGYAREIYLEVPEDQADWVTEVQLEITR